MRDAKKRPQRGEERAAREAADHSAAAKAVRELVAKLQRLIERGVRL